MLKEFKEFVMRGNVLDMAIGVIIGAAFGKIVSSLVSDILTPPLGLILGKMNFSDLFINLSDKPFVSLAEAQAAGAPTINYGLFLNHVINFLIVTTVIFFVIQKFAIRLRKEPDPVPIEPTTKECRHCYSAIPIKATRCPHCTSILNDE